MECQSIIELPSALFGVPSANGCCKNPFIIHLGGERCCEVKFLAKGNHTVVKTRIEPLHYHVCVGSRRNTDVGLEPA